MCYEKDRCERECLPSENKFCAQISSKVKTLKAFKETVTCVYGPSLEYGDEKSFSFSDTWTKESKPVNSLQKETLQSFVSKLGKRSWERGCHLCLFICCPLNPFVIFCAISILKSFLSLRLQPSLIRSRYYVRIAKSDVVTLRDSDVVARANERRLYSQAKVFCVNH